MTALCSKGNLLWDVRRMSVVQHLTPSHRLTLCSACWDVAMASADFERLLLRTKTLSFDNTLGVGDSSPSRSAISDSTRLILSSKLVATVHRISQKDCWNRCKAPESWKTKLLFLFPVPTLTTYNSHDQQNNRALRTPQTKLFTAICFARPNLPHILKKTWFPGAEHTTLQSGFVMSDWRTDGLTDWLLEQPRQTHYDCQSVSNMSVRLAFQKCAR